MSRTAWRIIGVLGPDEQAVAVRLALAMTLVVDTTDPVIVAMIERAAADAWIELDPAGFKIGLRRRRSHLYRCGNCGETFKREHELEAHVTPECPIVEIERQIARWNQSFLDERLSTTTTE